MKSNEKYSQGAQRRKFFKKINIVKKPSLLIMKNLTSQNTINCPGCGDIYDDPITDVCIRCGKCSQW
jgi:hypothetical protein